MNEYYYFAYELDNKTPFVCCHKINKFAIINFPKSKSDKFNH
jgi:hypothetical protein